MRSGSLEKEKGGRTGIRKEASQIVLVQKMRKKTQSRMRNDVLSVC